MPIPIYIKAVLWTSYLISLYFAVFWFLVLLDREPKARARKLKKFPSVSIVIPAYNEGKNIIKTLSSLINLHYPKNRLEIIVINDGSKDNTGDLVKGFIAKSKRWDIRLISKKNEGKGAALNDGLRAEKGEFFVCLDADSIAAKNALLNPVSAGTDHAFSSDKPRHFTASFSVIKTAPCIAEKSCARKNDDPEKDARPRSNPLP